ncbi:MAG: hypothetical protein ACTJLM_01655 [Ehrlichia sp.]
MRYVTSIDKNNASEKLRSSCIRFGKHISGFFIHRIARGHRCTFDSLNMLSG